MMMMVKAAFCMSIGALCSSVALACSPTKSIGIVFERNSAQVPAHEVVKLAEWTAMQRARYPHREAIFMTTQAAFGEEDAHSLGMRRAANVETVLTHVLRFDVQQVHLPAQAHVATRPAPEGSKLVKRVDIEFLPACPHECPCQRGDPLYQAPAAG